MPAMVPYRSLWRYTVSDFDMLEDLELQASIRARINAYIKSITPPDMQIIDGHYFTPYFEFFLVCDGSDPGMAYYCCLKPRHNGKCYSYGKHTYFTRVTNEEDNMSKQPPSKPAPKPINKPPKGEEKLAELLKKQGIHP